MRWVGVCACTANFRALCDGEDPTGSSQGLKPIMTPALCLLRSIMPAPIRLCCQKDGMLSQGKILYLTEKGKSKNHQGVGGFGGCGFKEIEKGLRLTG